METKDLINALNLGNNVEASDVFSSLMADKINSAMDDRKVQLGQAMMSGEEEQIEMDFESEEEVEENEDVFADSESEES
jgi:hypothetical protein